MDIVKCLIDDLRDQDPAERENALDRLGSLNPCNALTLALPLLADPVPGVRASAVTCLATVRDLEAIPHLLRVASDDESEDVREYAFMSLSSYTVPDVLEGLLRLLSLPTISNLSRVKIAMQLWKYDDDRVIEQLQRLILADRDPDVRLFSADSLIFLFRLRGCPPSWETVWRRAADDKCVGVFRTAEKALELLQRR